MFAAAAWSKRAGVVIVVRFLTALRFPAGGLSDRSVKLSG
jgi:hypothetical protein